MEPDSFVKIRNHYLSPRFNQRGFRRIYATYQYLLSIGGLRTPGTLRKRIFTVTGDFNRGNPPKICFFIKKTDLIDVTKKVIELLIDYLKDASVQEMNNASTIEAKNVMNGKNVNAGEDDQ